MRKHRNWWMGLGLGIAFGAMMLQLIDFSMEQPVLIADDGKMYTQEQLDEAVEEAIRQLPPPPSESPSDEPSSPGDGTALIPPGSGADGTGPAGTGPAGTGPATDPGASTGPADGAEPERIVAFYVNSGMSLSAVARSLKTLGVIDDAGEFTQAARPISKKIEVGTASFTGQPTFDEIIAELTRPKDD